MAFVKSGLPPGVEDASQFPLNTKPAGIPATCVSTYPFEAASVFIPGVAGIVT